ncbi:MAG TPA: flagellar basal-body MS-ring/collar protein FliF [Steroidobacteraceae bacterium]|nr:flagellar basal-body MS-ring/collar protein FliF [Steroidobacteraceae bacterium]
MNSGIRSILLLVGVAAAVAIGVAVALWSKEPTYSLLTSRVSDSEASKIVQSLETSAIPYQLDSASGAILVPADRLSDARMKLAQQGVGGSDSGFASMSKDPGFGVSQFMETARYQHALETELAQTIGNLQPVEGARVHLALPRQSAFLRDRKPASASVFVQLRSGRRLSDEQIESIVNLVASSIPELDAAQVTVIDQQGHLLSSPKGNDEYAMRDKQFEFARRIEEVYTHRVEQLLGALVGPDRVRAQVVADVEQAISEQAREQFNPASQVVRSEQQAEEMSRTAGGPQGVPGALTNQPPQGGVALPPGTNAASNAAATTASTGPDNSSKQSTRNYEIDRTLAYTKQLPGQLKRLSVAVAVDNTRKVNDDDTVTETPLTPEQIENYTRLVKDAVGFDEKRGDSVNVVNASFHVPPAAEQEAPVAGTPIWQQPWVRDLAKVLAGLIVLVLLVFRVIKPLLGSLVSSASQMSSLGGDMSAQGQLASPNGAPTAVNIAQQQYETQVNDARSAVQQDPRRVAQVVKAWVSTDE